MMFRLAFLVAVVCALFGGRAGNASVAVTSNDHDFAASLTDQRDADPSESGGAVSPVDAEPDIDSDDDQAAACQEECTLGRESAASVEPPFEIGQGPTQSHARRTERPPRA
jgi:hypothetical protein